MNEIFNSICKLFGVFANAFNPEIKLKCYEVLSVLSRFAIILVGKREREIVVILLLSS